MQCKHVSTTLVTAFLEDGTPARIPQCDMCGMIVIHPVSVNHLDDLPIDEIALQRAYKKLILSIFELARRP